MKEIVFIMIDLIEYSIQGALLVYLLQGMFTARIQTLDSNVTGRIFWVQYVLLHLILSEAPFAKRMIYGEAMVSNGSRMGSRSLAANFAAVLLLIFILYNGSILRKCYLTVIFYSACELLRLMLYPPATKFINWIINFYLYLWESGKLPSVDSYISLLLVTQIGWGILVFITEGVLLYFFIKKYRGYITMKEHHLENTQVCFLMIPGVTGLLLILLIRSVLFNLKGNQYQDLLVDFPEMYLIVPMICGLSIVTCLLSAKVLYKMVKDGNEKIEYKMYRDRVRGMEEHIKDVERLYDGICGMKHDMKHYIADMQALIEGQNLGSSEGVLELEEYLKGLSGSVDRLDMKYRTGNPVTDVIVNRYSQLAREKQIKFDSDFVFPPGLGISAFDLSIILNNGLENAFEECRRTKQELPYISIMSYCRGKMFFVEMKNSFHGILKFKSSGSLLDTSKKDRDLHGFGLKNISSCAEKYYGKAEVKAENGEFQLLVMLQGREGAVSVS